MSSSLMKRLLTLAVLAATPAHAGDFTYPKAFTVQPTQTLEQAQAYYTGQRRCALRWAAAGIVAGTALDIATTQSNQRAGYREVNPLYGKHASVIEQLAFHAMVGGFEFWRMTKSAKDYPAEACHAAKVGAALQLLPGLINIGVRIKF